MNNPDRILRPTTAILVLAVLLLGTACDGASQRNESAFDTESASQSQNQAAVSTTAVETPRFNRGRVSQIETAGGYTYASVDVDGKQFWLATSMTALEPGDEVAWKDYAMMRHFSSKTLNREFEQIMFIDRLTVIAAHPSPVHRGIVAESLSAAGYSFIRVEEDGRSIWLAAPLTSLSIGQTIEWSGGEAMRNFTSRSLNRVFEEIIFVDSVQVS